jgi:hypothetical protein
MHDPMTVAFEIRRPWPRREQWHDSVHPKRTKTLPRWDVGLSPFWTVAGRGIYWPGMITIWHVEPGGHDSGEVCKHYRREQVGDEWKTTILRGWRLHAHHWRIQVSPLQALRRRLLTRCEWCRGGSSKADPANISHQWNGERGPWWRGERGLFHHDCSSIATAHRACFCDDPLLDHDGWGKCAACGGSRSYGKRDPNVIRRQKLLATIPQGRRDAAKWEQVQAEFRAEQKAAESSRRG